MVKRNIIANFIGRAWTNLLGFIFIPFYLKFLGAEAYGLVGFFATLQSILGLLDFGIGSTMNRELARLSVRDGASTAQHDLVRTLGGVYWVLAMIGGLVIIAAAPIISRSWLNLQSFPAQEACDSIRLMGVAIALQFPMSLYQGGLMGLQRQAQVNIIIVVAGTVRGVGAMLLLWLVCPDIRIFFLWQVAVSAMSTAASFIVLQRNLPAAHRSPQFRISILKEIWRYAAAVSANAFVGLIMSQLDKIMLSKMLTLKMFGYYTIACTAAAALWSVIIPFTTAIFPQLVRLNEQQNAKQLTKFFHKASQMLSVLLFPIALVLAFFSKDIILLWTSRPEVAQYASNIVTILVLGTMLNGIAAMPGYAATAFGWPQLITFTNTFQAFLIVPLMWFLVTSYGAEGAAITYLLLNSTYVLFMTPVFFRRYLKKELWLWYIKDQIVPLFFCFITVWAFSAAMPHSLSKLELVAWLTFTWSVSLCVVALATEHVRTALATLWSVAVSRLRLAW